MDKLGVTMIGRLLDVFIRLSSNLVVTQTIDIYMVYIPNIYDMLLRRDWSSQLHGYFSIYYSHLWFPYKGKENQIRIYREPYMKHIVTELRAPNEIIPFRNLSHASYCVDTFFGYVQVDSSPFAVNSQYSKILICTKIDNPIHSLI